MIHIFHIDKRKEKMTTKLSIFFFAYTKDEFTRITGKDVSNLSSERKPHIQHQLIFIIA